MDIIEKVKKSKALNNDAFMSSIGLAFVFSFILGLFKMSSVELLYDAQLFIISITELMDNFNSCLYPSALALICVEFLHNNGVSQKMGW